MRISLCKLSKLHFASKIKDFCTTVGIWQANQASFHSAPSCQGCEALGSWGWCYCNPCIYPLHFYCKGVKYLIFSKLKAIVLNPLSYISIEGMNFFKNFSRRPLFVRTDNIKAMNMQWNKAIYSKKQQLFWYRRNNQLFQLIFAIS